MQNVYYFLLPLGALAGFVIPAEDTLDRRDILYMIEVFGMPLLAHGC